MNKEKHMNMQKSWTSYQHISETLSENMSELDWFKRHRTESFNQLGHLVPPIIERLDYSDWPLWNIEDLPINDNLSTKTTKLVPEEVLIYTFEEAFSKEKILFRKCFEESDFMTVEDFYQAYTSSFLTDGLFVYIPENVHVELPVELNFTQNKSVTNRQVLIYASANSSVKIIDQYESADAHYVNTLNNHIQIIAKEGSNVHYSSLDQLSEQTTGFIRRNARLRKDATVNWALGSMSNGNIIEDIEVFLEGSGSTSDVKTVAISNHQQTQVINVHVMNIGHNTIGNIFQHGVVLDQSTLTFNGIGRIIKNAKNSDAQQESRILMLSDDARADANPILLIDEYQVTAGHAASISRVDQTQLYYLMSRGLDEKQAEKLVIRGFLGSVLTEISNTEVRQELSETIERKLAQYGN